MAGTIAVVPQIADAVRVNRFMREIDSRPEEILPVPLQNTLTRPLRTAAAKAGRSEFLNLWAGCPHGAKAAGGGAGRAARDRSGSRCRASLGSFELPSATARNR
jgi:hypothetical protein